MIVVNVIGGLGNQMFQYAFGYAVSQKRGENLQLDISNFQSYTLRKYELNKYNIEVGFASYKDVGRLKPNKESILDKILRKFNRRYSSYYPEPFFNFDKRVFDIKTDTYYLGFWQSEKYFIEFRDILLQKFTLKNSLHKETSAYFQSIKETNSVSLHIRRGDYVTNVNAKTVHGLCPLSYYQDAVSKIEQLVDDPHFYIFSDDLGWAKDNLTFINNLTFIELNNNISDHEEMYLMSQCDHNIIANSSFSWWDAWLNTNKAKTVIAPLKYFKDASLNTKDLIPEPWISI